MSKLVDNYKAVNEGRMSKSEFLRQTLQQYPGYINQFTSFDDAVQIFRNKGILLENVECQSLGDRFPLEQIEKGIDAELEAMGYTNTCTPAPRDYKKAKERAIKNLTKDSLFYIKREAGHEPTQDDNKDQDMKKVKTLSESTDLEDDEPTTRATTREKSFTDKDKIHMQLVMSLLQKINPETGKKYTQQEARKKATRMIRMKNSKEKEAVKGQKILQENIQKIVAKVLTEAATTNLAQLSDENATIQGIPSILNSLENIVTEIESFILKEQEKIQNVFNQIGNIKNEDNIPIGYKFVEPILNSLEQDLRPVLEKINFDNLKLPQAPASDSTAFRDEDVENLTDFEDKKTVYSPRGKKPSPLDESKQNIKYRYTK